MYLGATEPQWDQYILKTDSKGHVGDETDRHNPDLVVASANAAVSIEVTTDEMVDKVGGDLIQRGKGNLECLSLHNPKVNE